ncbi:hypothetical protein SAMN05660772_01090 [Pasteurella testudinis DSM 23072]|uniref:Uncharacterized protein n=2 Tax=Pasteurella testudinis TaxID=761 RepID=A0A1W1V3W7_9PAST|nr:hypothetical protein SAMN05660772_01090 [Pasteurella testudinis DSM 23072]SUB51201.1 Uncharacterised protein [Pasteurella testudinis]
MTLLLSIINLFSTYYLLLINIGILICLILLCLFCYFHYKKEQYFLWCGLSAIFWIVFISATPIYAEQLFYNDTPLSNLNQIILTAFIIFFNLFNLTFSAQPFIKAEQSAVYVINLLILLLWLIPYFSLSLLFGFAAYMAVLLMLNHIMNMLICKSSHSLRLALLLMLGLTLGLIEFFKYLGLIYYQTSLILPISLLFSLGLSVMMLVDLRQARKSAINAHWQAHR